MTLPSADVLRSARATLAQALLDSGLRPTEQALYWMLGLVAGESKFGTTSDWTVPNDLNPPDVNPFSGPSHNWGAVRFWQNGNVPFVWHRDQGEGPGPGGSWKFQAYPSALEGAKGFLRTILLKKAGHDKVVQALTKDSGTPELLARGMYENGYYEGKAGTDDESKIAAYAAMIKGGGTSIAKALGTTLPEPSSGWEKAKGPALVLGGAALLLVSAWVTGAGPFEKANPSFRLAGARDRDRPPPGAPRDEDES